jgi:hypothetical protein
MSAGASASKCPSKAASLAGWFSATSLAELWPDINWVKEKSVATTKAILNDRVT